jgi:hypothetical protein
MDQEPGPAGVPQASFARSIKLVAWSLLGIRSRKGYQEDLAKVNPVHVLLVGLVAVLLLVASLIGLVNWVVAK